MLELGMMVNNEDNDDIKTIQKRVVNFGKLHKIILPLLFGFSRDDNWLIQLYSCTVHAAKCNVCL